MQDRRFFDRLLSEGVIKGVILSEEKEVVFDVLNISQIGFCIKVSDLLVRLDIEKEYEIVLDNSIKVTGKIVWNNSSTYGISLTTYNPQYSSFFQNVQMGIIAREQRKRDFATDVKLMADKFMKEEVGDQSFASYVVSNKIDKEHAAYIIMGFVRDYFETVIQNKFDGVTINDFAELILENLKRS